MVGPGALAVGAQQFEEDEDAVLVQRCLAGDDIAFTELVNKYRGQVYAIAYRFCGNHEESDDLAQETFIRAFHALHQFRRESAFRTWLFRITTNLSINILKSGRVSKDTGLEPNEVPQSLNPSGLDRMISSEGNCRLYRAIRQLPPKQKEALLLKTFGDMSCAEVAAVMRCSIGTVKANVFNAIKKLKLIMDVGGTR